MQEIDWNDIKRRLPFGSTQTQLQLREYYWKSFDNNGNGFISLSQLDKGVRDIIKLPIFFEMRPVIINAFNSAKNIKKSKNSKDNDFVSKAEFRYVLLFLRQYFEYWFAFDKIDTNSDKKISFQEFKQAIPIMKKWGIKMQDPLAVFKEADKDNLGTLSFNEFVEWSIKSHLSLHDND